MATADQLRITPFERGKVNFLRLKVFLEFLKQKNESISNHETLVSAAGVEILKNIDDGLWLDLSTEVSIVQQLADEHEAWDFLREAGRECFIGYYASLIPAPKTHTRTRELFFRIPSMVAFFLTHIRASVFETPSTLRVVISYENETDEFLADVLFLYGLLDAFLQYYKLDQFQVQLKNFKSLKKEELPAYLRHAEHSTRLLYEISPKDPSIKLIEHLEMQSEIVAFDAFVDSVMRKSSELLQEKRELSTAVEYLNIANQELEKQLNANKKELRMARNIQKGFVPSRIPDWKGLQFWIKFFPLTEVSGDFYDYISLGSEKMAVFVADVSGHGVPAALISAIAKLSFNNHRLDSPAEIFNKVNLDLLRFVKREGYLTAFYMIIDSEYNMIYSVGASPSPLLYKAGTGEVIKLPGSGTLLGMFPDGNDYYMDQRARLEPGDKLFIFTDGLPEAESSKDEAWGEEGLIRAIKESTDMNIQESSEYVISEYHKHVLGRGPRDDVTLLSIMLSKRTNEFDQLLGLAKKTYNGGNIGEACNLLEQAITIFPRHTGALFMLGKYLTRNKEYEKAIGYIVQYNMLKPYNADAYTLMAYCAYKMGNPEKAKDDLKRSLSLRSDNPSALYNLIRVYQKLDLMDSAASTLAALEFLRPNHPLVAKLRQRFPGSR